MRWDLGRYHDAVRDYQDALRLGADPSEVQPLLADSLLHAGRYADAADVLADHSPTGHPLDRVAAVVQVVLREVAARVGVTLQNRRGATHDEIAAAGEDPDRLADLLRSTDALDERVWLRLLTTAQVPLTGTAVVIAHLLVDAGRAWAVATLIALGEATNDELVSYIADTGLQLCRDDYLFAIEEIATVQDSNEGNLLREFVYAHADRLPPNRRSSLG